MHSLQPVTAFGRYNGVPETIDFRRFETGWAGALRRRLMRKAWWYAGVFAD